MKRELRVLGIDDAPFDKHKKGDVLVIGTFFRGGLCADGILSTKVRVDGSNATAKLITMINRSRFASSSQAIFLDGIALGGFNIVDVKKLSTATGLPVIVVVRRKPDIEDIKKTLTKIGMENKIRLIEKAGSPLKVGNIYVQLTNITKDRAKEMLAIVCTRSFLPEPIRLAHLIAAGIVKGESRGRA